MHGPSVLPVEASAFRSSFSPLFLCCMQAVARALRDLVGMAKKKNSVYYAVARGRQVGIFRSW